MNWYLKVLTQDAAFEGRAGRKEFWVFFLLYLLITFVLSLMEAFFEGPGYVVLLYSVAMVLPLLTVSVRRFHDIGHSGYWAIGVFIPIVCIIVFLFFLKKGENRSNRYGEAVD